MRLVRDEVSQQRGQLHSDGKCVCTTAVKIPSMTNEMLASWWGLWMRPVFLSIKSWVGSMWWLFFWLTGRERQKLTSQEDSKKSSLGSLKCTNLRQREIYIYLCSQFRVNVAAHVFPMIAAVSLWEERCSGSATVWFIYVLRPSDFSHHSLSQTAVVIISLLSTI